MPFENLAKEQPSIGCSFLLYGKLVVSYKAKNTARGCASCGEEVRCKQQRSRAEEAEKREAINITARARKCRKGLFVLLSELAVWQS